MSRADGQPAAQSLAEIGQLYPDGAGGLLDLDGQVCVAPDLDQLALHGAALEPTHTEPAVASVAQAERETQHPSAAKSATKPGQTWVDRARAYNQQRGLIEQFNAATHDACGSGGEADPNAVAAWQAAHGVKPDGRIGRITLATAVELGAKKPAETPAETPAKPEEKPGAPTPAVARTPASPEPAKQPAPTPEVAPTPVKDPAAAPENAPSDAPTLDPSTGVFSKVYVGGVGKHKQYTQVFVSPGKLTNTPNIFVHFHGHVAQYEIDPTQKDIKEVTTHHEKDGKSWDTTQKTQLSGIDVAGEAMAHGRDKNTIAMLPQGKVGASGRGAQEGGYMKALVDGLPAFIQSILDQLAVDLKKGALTPGHIGISGHSAGGYQGVASALANAKELEGSITDVTLMDTGYSKGHFVQTRDWMFGGDGTHPARTVRIVGQPHQLSKANRAKGYYDVFGKEALDGAVKAHKGFTVDHVETDEGVQRDANTKTRQHSKVYKDGKLHADVLVLEFSEKGGNDHQDLRDRVIDDSELSVGQGGADSDDYGRHDRGHDVGASAPSTTKQVAPALAKPKAKKPAPAVQHEAPKAKHDEHADEPAVKIGAPKASHAHKGYDEDKNHIDSYGNSTERSWSKQKNTTDGNHQIFQNTFTAIENANLFSGPTGKKALPQTLAKGTVVRVGEVGAWRVQIITNEFRAEDNVWVPFKSLGGQGADIGFGNERADAADKERADAIREGLPPGRNPGQSKHKWRFGGGFNPALDGVALDSSLMSKVHALMEWAIHNDMVLGDIVIGAGMRSPAHAHFMCVRYEIARNGMQNITMEALQALPNGRDADGHKWYEAGWTKEQVIANAEAMYSKGSKGAVAAAGYNYGDPRRAPLPLHSRPGVSQHCSGHAVDVDIPWRSEKVPTETDVWAWEQIYHQFGLTRPLHRDKGKPKRTQESWHIEETGKNLDLEPDHDVG